MKRILGTLVSLLWLVTYSQLGLAKNTTEVVSGIASYYAEQHHGKKTANGEKFNMYELTAAHRTLPFGSKIKVTNLTNGKSVVLRVNDRGPYVKGRILDVSKGAAIELGMIQRGTASIRIEKML
nr:MAG TPA: lipoprotein [Caudoviricetes sp.]